MDYAKESLKMHYDLKGKIEVVSRAKVDSKDALSLAYTPGVAQPCLEIQKDVNKSYDLTRRWNTVAVVTDGTAVLGLGDIGPEAGMPVMEGKCVLFKEFGGVDAIPLCVRKVFDVENADLGRYDDELGETLGEALLRPTIIYVKPVLRCIEAADVKGVSHITGGGFYENVPRCIPDGLCAKIDKAAVKTPAIFRLLQKKGGIDEHDMFNTFNMGVGMAVIVSPETADAALSALKAEGIDAYVCGEIVAGEEKVALC